MPEAAGRVTLSGTALEPAPKRAAAVSASNAVAVRRRVLIVTPHFPPVDAPDMQRVRVSLAHFREFGWDPYVLAVAPGAGDTLEPLFAETIDASIPVARVRAASSSLTRVLGIGNVAIRALPFLVHSRRAPHRAARHRSRVLLDDDVSVDATCEGVEGAFRNALRARLPGSVGHGLLRHAPGIIATAEVRARTPRARAHGTLDPRAGRRTRRGVRCLYQDIESAISVD